MAKTYAISTQNKMLKKEIDALKGEIEKLTKERDETKKRGDDWFKQYQERCAEIEQVNLLLDVLPGAAPRKSDDELSYNQKSYSLMTRLAAYLAARGA